MQHPLSYVNPDAQIGKDVEIGPFVTIDKNVVIGDGTRIMSNATILEGARIGKKLHHLPGSRRFGHSTRSQIQGRGNNGRNRRQHNPARIRNCKPWNRIERENRYREQLPAHGLRTYRPRLQTGQ